MITLRNVRNQTWLAAAIAAATLPVSAHATNGYFTHGFGARAQAVAGVSTALPQDALIAASNPAGISHVGNRLDVGVSLFRPVRGATVTGNLFGDNGRYDGNGTEYFVIPEFGYVRQLDNNLALGLAIYGNGGMNTDYAVNPLSAFGATGSAGASWATRRGGKWTVSYTHAFKERVKGQQSIPMPFGGGEADIHLKEDILTIGYSVRL